MGDAKNILGQLIEEIAEVKKMPDISDWNKKVTGWKKKHPLNYRKSSKNIKPQAIIEELYRQTKGKAIIVTEVGQNQMWAAQFYKYDFPRHFLSSGGLGTMGYGFPAAIGAKVANPDKEVVVIAGDGSFQMNIQELATLATYDIGVKVIILNNHCLGMVRQWQQLFYDRRYSGTPLKNPNFVKVASGFGVKGIKVTKPSEMKKAIKNMLSSKSAVIADFWIEEEENVFPMVPAGQAIDRMISGMA